MQGSSSLGSGMSVVMASLFRISEASTTIRAPHRKRTMTWTKCMWWCILQRRRVSFCRGSSTDSGTGGWEASALRMAIILSSRPCSKGSSNSSTVVAHRRKIMASCKMIPMACSRIEKKSCRTSCLMPSSKMQAPPLCRRWSRVLTRANTSPSPVRGCKGYNDVDAACAPPFVGQSDVKESSRRGVSLSRSPSLAASSTCRKWLARPERPGCASW
mmetsp:Transcript_34908/g.97985  ORF Transcript_34908/g.97985 Transcript_34908/m.97985 type:complete len:215 (-) Transcript_34908:101-745(-)